MKSESPLRIGSRETAGVRFHVLEAEEVPALAECFVAGVENQRGGREVINAIVQGERARLQREWKLKVADAVHQTRTRETPPVPSIVSIVFLLCPSNHGGHRYDVENFVKPVIDAVAMGLWGEIYTVRKDPSARFNADDSVFRSIYLESCQGDDALAEGVYVAVSPLSLEPVRHRSVVET